MATLASIKKQIADLEKKANKLLKAESDKIIAKVKDLIERHGLTAEDLGFVSTSGAKSAKSKKAKGTRHGAKGRKGSAPKSIGLPVYRDPKSGKTWTGRGKAPGWIAGAKDRSKFLIETAGTASTPATDIGTARSSVRPKRAIVARTAKRAAAASKPAQKAASKKAAAKSAATPVRKAGAKPPKAARSVTRAPAPKKSAGGRVAKGRKAAPPPPAPAIT